MRSAIAYAGAWTLVAVGACVGAPMAPKGPPKEATEPQPVAQLPEAGQGEDGESPATAAATAPAPTPEATPTPTLPTSACNDQSPQDFLIRGNFLKVPDGNKRAIQYRTDTYGYFQGFGHPAPGAQPPRDFLVDTTFMGLKVKMHRKVAPALACVEAEIVATCADHPYKAHALAGIRYRNTYRGGEVTNHAYGIAIDVDPDLNTCCGCVPPWNDAPRCKRPAKTEYDRMIMPECWVHAFERFGFYWLGHDVLRDTMHYEFLGDPDKIVRQ